MIVKHLLCGGLMHGKIKRATEGVHQYLKTMLTSRDWFPLISANCSGNLAHQGRWKVGKRKWQWKFLPRLLAHWRKCHLNLAREVYRTLRLQEQVLLAGEATKSVHLNRPVLKRKRVGNKDALRRIAKLLQYRGTHIATKLLPNEVQVGFCSSVPKVSWLVCGLLQLYEQALCVYMPQICHKPTNRAFCRS